MPRGGLPKGLQVYFGTSYIQPVTFDDQGRWRMRFLPTVNRPPRLAACVRPDARLSAKR